MKLVQKPLTTCASAICVILALIATAAAAEPEYVRFYDPAKGFKPAQTSLTEIFLQIAGSLEATGSPEPYIRHIQAEHARVSAKYQAKTGKANAGRMPTQMTAEYLDKLIANWNLLSPKLQLDAFAKAAGRYTREGIRGTRDGGTIVVSILNEHQKKVLADMKSPGLNSGAFERLRLELNRQLEFDKAKISMAGYELDRRDAVSYAIIFRGQQDELFARLDSAIGPQKAAPLKAAINGVFLDLGELAQSEFQIAMIEWSLD